MGRTNINIPVPSELRERVNHTAKTFGFTTSYLVRDMLDAFSMRGDIPEEFIEKYNINFLLKSGAPVRTITPFLAAHFNMDLMSDFELKDKHDNKITLDPYPEYSLVCKIRMIEKFYLAKKALDGQE